MAKKSKSLWDDHRKENRFLFIIKEKKPEMIAKIKIKFNWKMWKLHESRPVTMYLSVDYELENEKKTNRLFAIAKKIGYQAKCSKIVNKVTHHDLLSANCVQIMHNMCQLHLKYRILVPRARFIWSYVYFFPFSFFLYVDHSFVVFIILLEHLD